MKNDFEKIAEKAFTNTADGGAILLALLAIAEKLDRIANVLEEMNDKEDS